MALLLLIGAGLLIRSFAALQAVDPGFDAASVLAVDLSLPRISYPDDAAVIGFFDKLRESVGALPGVERAAFVRVLPLDTTIGDSGVEIEGRPLAPNSLRPAGDWQVASPGYFEAMGLKLVVGNVRHNGIEAPVKPKHYVPDAQFGAVFGAARRSMTLVVKTSVAPSTLASPVRATRVDPVKALRYE